MAILDQYGRQLLGPPVTRNYRQTYERPFMQPRDLPRFDFSIIRYMLLDPTIRLGLAMRAAPLQQAEFAYEVTGADGESKWVPGIQADDPNVGAWILRQLRRIWKFDLFKLLLAQIWGWSGCEVTYRLIDGKIHVDRLLHRHARDTLALVNDGELGGVRFQRVNRHNQGFADLEFPKSVWHAYNPESESAYGISALLGAYNPWADKWLNGGALDVRRLFNWKYAYGGTDIGYPEGTSYDPELGKEVPNRDIARQLAEQAETGAVIVHPSEQQDGSPMWPVEHVDVPATPQHVYDFPKDLDTEELRGLEIPDDVLESEASGAWQGKQVPMQAFYCNADRWLAQIVQCISTQVLEPMVLLNEGQAVGFEVKTKPLAEQAFEQIQDKETGVGEQDQNQVAGPMQTRPAIQQQPGLRFSLDGECEPVLAAEQLIGRGVLKASDLVDAGRRYLDSSMPYYAGNGSGRSRLSLSNGSNGSGGGNSALTVSQVSRMFSLNADEVAYLHSRYQR